MCKSYRYKGLIIYENFKSPNFGTTYYSVVNPKRKDGAGRLLHCHTTTEAHARKVVDCFNQLARNGYCRRYSLNIRNKAMRLNGYNIKSVG